MDKKSFITKEEFEKLDKELIEWFYLLGQIDGGSRVLGGMMKVDHDNNKNYFNFRLNEFKERNVE